MGGCYRYRSDILKLDGCRPHRVSRLPDKFSRITTPLRAEEWEVDLEDFPDRACANYFLRGIGEGFRVGFQYQEHTCSSATSNMQSALDNTGVVGKYLREGERSRVHSWPSQPNGSDRVADSRLG